jgi:hypothetical protein
MFRYFAWKTDSLLNPLSDKERLFVSKNMRMVCELLSYEEGVEYTSGASVICKDGTRWYVRYSGE